MSHHVARRRVRSTASCLALLAALHPAAHLAAQDAPSLLPLDAGRRWTYRVSTREGNLLMEGAGGQTPAPTVRTLTVRVDGDRVVVEGEGKEQHVAALSRTPAPPEAHSEGHVPALRAFFLRDTVAPPIIPDAHRSTAKIDVPAGTYDAVVYRRHEALGLGSYSIERHFAPGVGLVKERAMSEVEGGYREVVWELVSVTTE